MTGSAPPSPIRATTSSGVRGVLTGLRIVIVDDDNDARDLLATVLTQRGAVAFDASCAADGFELVERELPDVLISDIAMPEQDGYMLVARVRRLPPDRGGLTPAIAVTAYAGRADYTRAIEAGFDAHFSKPVDLDLLVDKIADLIATRAVVAKAR